MRKILISTLLALVVAGCQTPIRSDESLIIEGMVKKQGLYPIPHTNFITVNDLISEAGGLKEGKEVARVAFVNEADNSQISVRRAQWDVPLSELGIDLKTYRRLLVLWRLH